MSTRMSSSLTNANWGNEAVITLPIIGDERLAFDANFVEEMFAPAKIAGPLAP
jgi:hypothetical protein